VHFQENKSFKVTLSAINASFLIASLLFYVATNSNIKGLLSLLFHNEIFFKQWIFIGFLYMYMGLWISIRLGPIIGLNLKPSCC
jgi:hypothetical protein